MTGNPPPNTSPPRLRSLLIAPASRPDMCAKLPRSGPDAVALDLEDAVAPAAKAGARAQARIATAELHDRHPELTIFVRLNPPGSEWFSGDVAEGLAGGLTGVVVPKLESGAQVDRVLAALERAGREDLLILAGIETAAGVARAADVLGHPGVAAAYFGAEDFITDMGGVRTAGGLEVLYARSQVALAARLSGVPALDQVVIEFGDDNRFRTDASLGRSMGYRGKLCIHPAQVPLANQCFSPSAAERDRARALLAVWDQALARGEASVAFEGQMIDEPLARRARAVLDE